MSEKYNLNRFIERQNEDFTGSDPIMLQEE